MANGQITTTTNISVNSTNIPNSTRTMNKNSSVVKEYYKKVQYYKNEFLQAPTPKQKMNSKSNMKSYTQRSAYLEKDFMSKLRNVKNPGELSAINRKDALKSTIRDRIISSNLTAATANFQMTKDFIESQTLNYTTTCNSSQKIPDVLKPNSPNKKFASGTCGESIKADYKNLVKQVGSVDERKPLPENSMLRKTISEMEFRKNPKNLEKEKRN